MRNASSVKRMKTNDFSNSNTIGNKQNFDGGRDKKEYENRKSIYPTLSNTLEKEKEADNNIPNSPRTAKDLDQRDSASLAGSSTPISSDGTSSKNIHNNLKDDQSPTSNSHFSHSHVPLISSSSTVLLPSKLYNFYENYRIVTPHYFVYKTFVKSRWIGRSILNVFQNEFRDRPIQYYERAIKKGWIKLDDKSVHLDTTLKDNQCIKHVIHRHEPIVSNIPPIKIINYDDHFLIVDKPSSIPVHPTGRYFHNSISEILKNENGFSHISNINRLDRLTSGLLLMATSKEKAAELHTKMADRSIKKEYLAKVNGIFPIDEIFCDEPLITIEHKLGLCSVNREKGKPSKTIFKRIGIDLNTNTSLVLCKPLTGRTHQIRVHLQYLGYPIIGDTLYNNEIWAESIKDKRKNSKLSSNPSFESESSLQFKGMEGLTWTSEELIKISQLLLAQVQTEEINRYVGTIDASFKDIFSQSEPSRCQLPEWFDIDCEDCQRQWIRSYENPAIPLILPYDYPKKIHTLALHAFKYYTESWDYSVPWPEWAKEMSIN